MLTVQITLTPAGQIQIAYPQGQPPPPPALVACLLDKAREALRDSALAAALTGTNGSRLVLPDGSPAPPGG